MYKPSFKTQQSKTAACCTHRLYRHSFSAGHRHLYNGICSASPDKQARQRLLGSAAGEDRRKPLITGILSPSSRAGIFSPTSPAFSLSIICSHTHSMIVFNLYIKLSFTSNTSTGSFSFSGARLTTERAYKEMVESKLNLAWLSQLWPALHSSLQPPSLFSRYFKY